MFLTPRHTEFLSIKQDSETMGSIIFLIPLPPVQRQQFLQTTDLKANPNLWEKSAQPSIHQLFVK